MKNNFEKSALKTLAEIKKQFVKNNERGSAGKTSRLIAWGKKDGNLQNYAMIRAESQGIVSALENAYAGYLKRN